MHNGIGVGRLLFFSFLAVFLIPVITLGYFNVELEKRGMAAEKALLIHEYRDIQRILLRDHVGRTISLIHDRMTEAVSVPDTFHRSTIDLQAQMLRRIRRIRFGESGHMFVLSGKGVLLADSWMQEKVGENVLATADSTGRKIFTHLLNEALSDSGGGYVEYFSNMPGKAGQRLNIAFARYLPEWEWIVCANVFSEDMDQPISVWEKSHLRALHDLWKMRGSVFLIVLFVSLFVSFLLSRFVRREFTIFSRAFENAALSRGSLDTSRLNLREFRLLSDSVNRVLGERDKAEKAISVSEEKFARMFRLSPNLMLLMDASTRAILDINDACLHTLGLRLEEAIGRDASEYNIWVEPEERERVWKEALEKGCLENRAVHFYNHRREERTGLLSVEVMRMGKRDVVLVVVNDITSLERAREELREKERRISTLMDNLPGLMYRCRNDAFWTFEYASEGALEITGYTPADLVGNRTVSWNDLIVTEDRDMVRRNVDHALAQSLPYVLEYRISDRDGGEKWVLEKGLGVHEPRGDVIVLEGFITDITERKRVEEALRASEEKLRFMAENSTDIIWRLDENFRFTYISATGEGLRGYTREEIIGMSLFQILTPEGIEQVRREYALRLEKEKLGFLTDSARYELQMKNRDGSLVWTEVSVNPYRDQEGRMSGYHGMIHDITKRKAAEEALRASEEKYRQLVENAQEIIVVIQAERLVFANKKTTDILGYSLEEFTTRPFTDFIDPSSRELVMERYAARIRGDAPVRYPFRALHKNGDLLWMEINAVLIQWEGEPALLVFLTDISDRKIVEEELRESEEKHRILLDESSDPVFSFASDGRYLYVNRAFALGVRKSVEEIIGNRIWDVFDKEEADKRFAVLDKVFRTGEEIIFEVRVPRPDGDRFYLTTVTPIKDIRGNTMTVICSSKEITERVRADEALLEEKERLAVTLRSIGDGVITTDRQGRVLLLNWVAEELTGWTQAEAEGRGLEEVFHIVHEGTRERCENPVNRVLATGGIVGLANNTLLVARDGREILIGDSGAPILDRQSRIIGVVLVFRDVTTQKRMEDELLRMEKLESVGVLAGGIAHDFNNILTGILGAISMARLYIGTGHTAHGMLQEAEHQSLRARDLTGQLLTFSKGGAPVRITASIVETVRETVNFALRGSRIRADFSLPENLWTALVDLNQLSHVVNNLTLNSVQAMPEGGRIEVVAQNTTLGEDSGLPLARGRYILLSFRDYGVGISREHLFRIFDPYFTTKQMGSGLGLATSWSIVKRHDGHIRVESELGVGTVFHIYLPATGEETSAPPEEPERLFLGQGRVLIMDDDDGIRKTASMLLEAMGYSAAAVDDGAAAIEAYRRAREEGASFDAVIMDLTVPGGMGGLEAMEGLLALDPGVRVIVSSGYSTDPIMAEYSRHGFAGVLVKPYCAEDISRALRQVMGII